MSKNTTAATPVSTTATYEMDETLALMYEAMVDTEEAPPASEERPSLHLVTPPPASEEPERAPEVAPLAHTCPRCGAQVANLPGVWSEKYGLCKACAAPQLRKEEAEARKATKTCKCGNYKRADKPLCRDCYEKQVAEKADARKAAEANRLVCPKCGGQKDEAYHKVCRNCFTASRHAPRPQQARKVNGREIPTYKVDPRMQAKANARAKLGNALLTAHRAGELDKSYPGAKVTQDKANNALVCIAYGGDSFTVKDEAKVRAIAEREAIQAKADAIEKAQAARKAAEQRKAAAAAAKANKSNSPKKGKKGKSSEGSAKPSKAERKAARKGK